MMGFVKGNESLNSELSGNALLHTFRSHFVKYGHYLLFSVNDTGVGIGMFSGFHSYQRRYLSSPKMKYYLSFTFLYIYICCITEAVTLIFSIKRVLRFLYLVYIIENGFYLSKY